MRTHHFVSRAFLLVLLAALGALLPSNTFGQAFGLTKIDINNPVEGLLTDNGDGSWTVEAGGGDTWDVADSFTYLYEQKDGDFDVKVKVVSLSVDNVTQQDSAKASLHIRSNLTPGSPDIMINGTPEDGPNHYIETIWRPAQDAGADDSPVNNFFRGNGPYANTFQNTPLYPIWLRVQRHGNTFLTMHSIDGINWTGLAEFTANPAQFPHTVYVGLSTVAHIDANEDPNNRVRATYSNYGSADPVPAIGGTPAPADRQPGYLPTPSVTAINISMTDPADGVVRDAFGVSQGFIVINADRKNEYLATIDGQGPIAWSVPGYNQGDLDISLSPHDPSLAQSNLGPYSNPNRERDQPGTDDERSARPQSQAWLPSTRDGLIIGSVRKNGQQWNDYGDGSSTPTFYAFSSVSVDFSSRKGYSMIGGNFENGEIYFSVFKLGEYEPALPPTASPFGLREANINVALAWFPFAQGWKAGYIGDATQGPTAYWRKLSSHSGALVEDTASTFNAAQNTANAIVQWTQLPDSSYGGLAKFTLPGVNSMSDGMLFVTSNDDESDNEGQVMTATPASDGSGWTIAIRQDDGDHDLAHYSQASRTEFGFVYIPFDSQKLIGAYVQTLFGEVNPIQSAGNFGLTRLGAGQYQLTVPGKTGHDGMLLLQNAGNHPDIPDTLDDSVFSYEYVGNNHFVIEARHAEGDNISADSFPLRDTDFCFAWVDFTDPVQPPPPCHDPIVPVGGSAPGPCPTFSVSAANWIALGTAGVFDGNVNMNLAEQGPIAWSVPRYNRGDFAIRISPADPVAARENLNIGSVSSSLDTADHPAAQAWRLNTDRGVVIPTVRQNGPIDWNDGAGPFYPTIAMNAGSSSGFGYDMVTGAFGNFGPGGIDINTGKAGDQGAEPSPEGNFNFATTWFPYAQGWVGGAQGNPAVDGSATWAFTDGHSPGLLSSIVTWFNLGGAGFGGAGLLALPGVNAQSAGMLFTASSQGDSTLNTMASAPKADGSGWVLTIREDSVADPADSGGGIARGQSQFVFVYVPYASQGVVGGHIRGTDGAVLHGAGSFNISRASAGSYRLSIPGKSGSTGVLLLQNATMVAGSDETLADNAILSYEYNAGVGAFIIQAVRTTGATGAATAADTDFYVTYVDFTKPVAPADSTPTPPPPSVPTLHYARAGSQVTLSWDNPLFLLQSSSVLGQPNSWTPVTTTGGKTPVTVTISASGNQFYRLVSPF